MLGLPLPTLMSPYPLTSEAPSINSLLDCGRGGGVSLTRLIYSFDPTDEGVPSSAGSFSRATVVSSSSPFTKSKIQHIIKFLIERSSILRLIDITGKYFKPTP